MQKCEHLINWEDIMGSNTGYTLSRSQVAACFQSFSLRLVARLGGSSFER